MSIANVSRREFLVRLAVAPIVTALPLPRKARPPITVYKTATCGCCKDWVKHVEKAGFKATVKDVPEAQLSQIKKDLGLPPGLASCHTTVVGAYLIEGHVPADLIDKLLAEKPKARGLTIPGMPASAPGMDMPGTKYDVLIFTTDGKTRVYASR